MGRDFNWLVHDINRVFAARGVVHARGRLLDIGCGRRPYRDLYQPATTRSIGLDDPRSGMPSVADVRGDAVALPFAAKSFDTVTAFQVLEHVADPGAVLAEIHRVLAPGGSLIMATPFLWGIHDAPRDYYRYTPYGLRHLLKRAGFEVVSIEPVCGLWAVVGLRVAYRLYELRPFRSPLMQPLFWILNRGAGWLDRLDFVESDAGGYFTVASRRTGGP